MDRHAVNQIIETFGGVAALCGKVNAAGWPLKTGSVYKWRNVGRIPELWGARFLVTAEKYGCDLDRDLLFRAFGTSPDQDAAA